jgi:hypothetical protein
VREQSATASDMRSSPHGMQGRRSCRGVMTTWSRRSAPPAERYDDDQPRPGRPLTLGFRRSRVASATS